MRKVLRITTLNMDKMSDSKLPLSKKFNRRVNKLIHEENLVEPSTSVKDIEETGTIKSQYFSPIQTRQQRLTAANPVGTSYKLPEMKRKNNQLPLINKKLITENIKESETVDKKLQESEKIKGGEIKWEPVNWRQMLENIREMRSKCSAPVDTMGCHKCSDEDCDEKTQRFQKLVALMLSSQTKDETTFQAMQRLKTTGLTPESIITMGSKLEELLRPVSFYKNKAKYIQETSRILIDKYSGDIPNNVKELIALPGVGPKMAHICMATAWNETTGIGVDVHVHRIANRLRWIEKETKEPEKTRLALEGWLPRDLWREVNHLLVGFGQTICTPVRPHCGDCLNRNICPFSVKVPKNKTKVNT